METYQHALLFRKALPDDTPDEAVYKVLGYARELLKEIAGRSATDIQFRHRVDERTAQLGGPLGQVINVVYIQLGMRFNLPTVMMGPEMRRLFEDFQVTRIDDVVRRAVEEAQREAAAMAKQVVEEAKNRPDPVRELSDAVYLTPAKDVPLGKMVITDDIAFARQMNADGQTALTNEPEKEK